MAVEVMPSPSPHSPPEVAGRAVPGVLRVGEQALLLTCCSTHKSGSRTSPGQQHGGARPDGEGAKEKS